MNVLVWAVALLVFLSDQASKLFISGRLRPGESVEVVRNIFYITLVNNTGAAFGIFKDQTLLFVIVSVLAVAAIFLYMKKQKHCPPVVKLSLALVLGGAGGNLVDRLRLGYVIDFFDFRIWPVFNIADSAITLGAFLLIVGFLCTRSCSR